MLDYFSTYLFKVFEIVSQRPGGGGVWYAANHETLLSSSQTCSLPTAVPVHMEPANGTDQVVRARDAGSIYLPLTLAQCLNTALWTAYGVFAVDDVFVSAEKSSFPKKSEYRSSVDPDV